MIYLVTEQQRFFKSDAYEIMSKEEALNRILEHTWIEYDSETEGLDPYTKALLCIQFGLGEDQIIVDTTTIDVNYFRPVFENPDITLLGWNLSFDLKFLYHHRIVPVISTENLNTFSFMLYGALSSISAPSGRFDILFFR